MKKLSFVFLSFIIYSSLNANNFTHFYKVGNFKVFYTFKGKNKLPIYNQVDKNNNGTPDYIEFVGDQLHKSDQIFESLGYMHPLNSFRYREKAHFIAVHIVSIQTNGTAYDEISKARKNQKGKSQAHLIIKISNKLSQNSLTPLHKYFYLLLNGYTMFKNRWYTDGSSKWSGSLLKKGLGENRPLPKSNVELDTMLLQTYATSTMWNRLTYLVDEKGCEPLGLSGYKICGTGFMKKFLENLSRYDKIAARDMGYQKYRWKESNQQSSKNNRYILRALADTIANSKSNDAEVRRFLTLLNSYI